MTAKGGRPRTFPPGAVAAALERRDRTGETWAELGKALGVHPGTLKARAAEIRRSAAYKTPSPASDEPGAAVRSSEAEIVLETYRPPALCPTCGMIHSAEVPCP